jgi:hypothetical protein
MSDYKTLLVSSSHAVMTVTLSNPPINLETDAMMADLDRLVTFLEGDRETKVVVFRSDTPGYFMAHFDIAPGPGRVLPPLGAPPQHGVLHSLGEGLHVELKPLGVHVTVLQPGMTDTPVIAKFGLDPDTMLTPMKVERCVSEALEALEENRSMIVPGRLNRIMNAVVPASAARGMVASMLRKMLASRPAKAQPQVTTQTQPQPKPR